MRIKVISWLVGIVFVCIGLAVINLQVVRGRAFKEMSDKNCIRLLPQEGSRGRILDRAGSVLVGNSLSYDVMILPQEQSAAQQEKLLVKVSQVLGTSLSGLKERLKSNFLSSSLPVTIARNIDPRKAIALEEVRMDEPSLLVQARPVRSYPFGRLAAHAIGYLNEIDQWRLTRLADYGYKTKDIMGYGGIEEKYDYYLRQEEGGLSTEVDHRGRFVRVLGFKPPRNGRDIELTIDVKVQKIVEEVLGQRKGSVVIMDPDSGEIIAMASRPDFDPADFVKKTDPVSLGSLFNDSEAPLINRAITGVYPPGSVFKTVPASAGLESGKINASTTFVCPGSFNLGGRQFLCWDTHHEQDLNGAIAHSCDVFFYHTGLLVGIQGLYEEALRFGFSRPTGIDLPYESSGFIPSPLWKRLTRFKSWYNGDTVNVSIGQGDVMVTPLQVARMMAIFANKGTLVSPYIIKAIDGRDVSRKKKTQVALKESTIELVRQGLRSVVSNPQGTANVLSGLPVSVAGKTGTAQVSRGQPHAWFVGFLPFKKPRFVICVFLEHGGSGVFSVLVAKQIIERMSAEGLV